VHSFEHNTEKYMRIDSAMRDQMLKK